MATEQSIIAHFPHPLNGDDAAVLGASGGPAMTVSCDLFVEGTHFKSGWLTPRQIGFKAMVVNISDAVAMNAVPKYALLGLGLPKNYGAASTAQLASGLKEAAQKYGCQIIGGDTVASERLFISITILAVSDAAKMGVWAEDSAKMGPRVKDSAKMGPQAKRHDKIVKRSGAKMGDLIAFTGSVGGSHKGLKTLLNGGKLAPNSRFIRPVLRPQFMRRAAPFLSAAMDISDGLASDLEKLIPQKGIGWLKKMSKNELISGEEYELLIAFCPRHLKRLQNAAKTARTPLNIIGKITRGKVKIYGKFSHF